MFPLLSHALRTISKDFKWLLCFFIVKQSSQVSPESRSLQRRPWSRCKWTVRDYFSFLQGQILRKVRTFVFMHN